MGGSTADAPMTPEDLRASDAEREHAVSELRNEFVEGRLSHETFVYRMQTAMDARNRGQLAGLFADLPPRRARLLDRLRAAFRGGRYLGPPGPAGRPLPRDQRWPASPAPFTFPPGSGVRFVIGRSRDCDLCLSDLSVSRRHAQLVRREDGWILTDLGSHNGTRLNGWLVREPVRLSAGDRVDFGSVAFVIAEVPPPWPAERVLPAGLPEPGPSG
jgi:hypothetical protein